MQVISPETRAETDSTFASLAATLTRHVQEDHPPHSLGPNTPARRDAHPKHHGCVCATFTVHKPADVPSHLHDQVFCGVFQPGARYEALIRFSNAFKVKHDVQPDARGMAIKLLGVKGKPVTRPDLSAVLPAVDGQPPSLLREDGQTQDFLLVTHSEFFGQTAADFLRIVSAILKTGGSLALALTFFSLKPLRIQIRNFVALVKTNRLTSNPLFNTYFSQTPYRMGGIDVGDDERLPAAKFCARPKQHPTWLQRLVFYVRVAEELPSMPQSSCNLLRHSLSRHLADHDAEYEFCVQMRNAPDLMPLDDATRRWSTDMSPYVPIATIRIHQDPNYAHEAFITERLALGERLSYTPWHALDAHRPLGSINRARLFVYAMVSKTRSHLNHTTATVPKSVCDHAAGSAPGQ